MKKSKYIELADKVKRLIKDENFLLGDKLPSERELATRFNLNHITVRKGLELLRKEELIYKVPSIGNFVGNNPKNKSSKLIGVMFPDNESFYFNILTELENYFMLFGYTPVLHITHRSVEREANIIEKFKKLNVAGIISSPNLECLQLYKKVKIPTLFFDTFIKELKIPAIITDDYKGGCDAVEHLISLGHKKIAYIGAEKDGTSDERLKGYKDTLAKYNLPISSDYIKCEQFTMQWGYTAIKILTDAPSPPTAIFAGSDTIAAGVIEYLRNNDLIKDSNLSIVGFGNLNLSPALGLTTIEQSSSLMGKTIWDSIYSLINGKMVTPLTILPTTLLLRRTTTAIKEI